MADAIMNSNGFPGSPAGATESFLSALNHDNQPVEIPLAQIRQITWLNGARIIVQFNDGHELKAICVDSAQSLTNIVNKITSVCPGVVIR